MCDPWFYMKSVWGRGMVELTDLPKHHNYI